MNINKRAKYSPTISRHLLPGKLDARASVLLGRLANQPLVLPFKLALTQVAGQVSRKVQVSSRVRARAMPTTIGGQAGRPKIVGGGPASVRARASGAI